MLQPFLYKTKIEAGLDEAGRGCFAGPVVAAAVILPKTFYHPLLNDSKQLSEDERNELRPIIEKEAISFAVAFVDNDEIDRINILQASFKAMHLAVDNLKRKPNLLLVDGNRFLPYGDTKHKCIIKGDGLFTSIAAASILAKTHRDEYMQQLHEEFSYYGWNSNKGYGTPMHRDAINEKGICKYHRKTFSMLGDYAITVDQTHLHLHEEPSTHQLYNPQ
ncbi:MAG: ribonuclease HII [Chitinophagaceae bacterium]|nr:MAG: ribonuclease HII [Chitinophagaceae bacterium]